MEIRQEHSLSSESAPKLSRNVRRALKKAARKSGRTTQHHRSSRQIIQEDGYRALAPIIPITEKEHQHMDSFLMVRYRECREGRGDRSMWGCLYTALLEGWSILKYSTIENADFLRRTLIAAARAWDAAYLHFLKSGVVNEANMDTLLSAINIVLDLKKEFRRDELLFIMESLEKNIDQFTREIFDGGYPKCGWEPLKLYEEKNKTPIAEWSKLA